MTESRLIELGIDDEGFSEPIHVRPLGSSLFLLEDTPILCNLDDEPIYLGDIIETEALVDGTHRLLRVAERSPLRHYSWIVPEFFVESPEYSRFAESIKSVGGDWEGALGGLLYVHLPVDCTFDPQAELDRRIAAARHTVPEP